LLIYALPLLAVAAVAWVLRRRHGRRPAAQRGRATTPPGLRQNAGVASASSWTGIGRPVLLWAKCRLTRPCWYVPLLLATAVLAAVLIIVLCRPTADGSASLAQAESHPGPGETHGSAAAEAASAGQLADHAADPAAGDRFLARRQRTGAAVLGGLFVLMLLLLAFGSRISRWGVVS
jgi:hypothetical protein